MARQALATTISVRHPVAQNPAVSSQISPSPIQLATLIHTDKDAVSMARGAVSGFVSTAVTFHHASERNPQPPAAPTGSSNGHAVGHPALLQLISKAFVGPEGPARRYAQMQSAHHSCPPCPLAEEFARSHARPNPVLAPRRARSLSPLSRLCFMAAAH